MAPELAHIDAWLFDMDNTLYHPRSNLFAQIDRRMEAYVGRLLGCDAVEARRVQKAYFHEHGTTLRGLMLNHNVDPHEFLNDVHAIDCGVLSADPRLRAALERLPGRRIVFTNGDVDYAARVLEALRLADLFEHVFDIHAMAYRPKPDILAYQALVEATGIDPTRSVFVEDMAANLRPAKALGMSTVWVNNGSERGDHDACASYIDFEVSDLPLWLEAVTGKGGD
jgi:putative hydrolase of the HAD superfamily